MPRLEKARCPGPTSGGREWKMKFRAALAISLIIAGATPYCAFAGPVLTNESGNFSPRLVEKVSCDTRNEDKQARCMQDCDDAWIKVTQAYNANIDQAKGEKKACETKCG